MCMNRGKRQKLLNRIKFKTKNTHHNRDEEFVGWTYQ